MNSQYVLQAAQPGGELRVALLYGYGPASYNQATGDPIFNAAASEYISFPHGSISLSGSYAVSAQPLAVGNLQVRAGAPSPGQSGWVWIWKYSGKQTVISVVQNAAGTGMTPGTYPLVATGGGGTGFAGTVTVLTATTIATPVITNNGAGYATAPTITSPATGGTPPTYTATVAPTAGVVPAGTNLSQEIVQFSGVISQI